MEFINIAPDNAKESVRPVQPVGLSDRGQLGTETASRSPAIAKETKRKMQENFL